MLDAIQERTEFEMRAVHRGVAALACERHATESPESRSRLRLPVMAG